MNWDFHTCGRYDMPSLILLKVQLKSERDSYDVAPWRHLSVLKDRLSPAHVLGSRVAAILFSFVFICFLLKCSFFHEHWTKVTFVVVHWLFEFLICLCFDEADCDYKSSYCEGEVSLCFSLNHLDVNGSRGNQPFEGRPRFIKEPLPSKCIDRPENGDILLQTVPDAEHNQVPNLVCWGYIGTVQMDWVTY